MRSDTLSVRSGTLSLLPDQLTRLLQESGIPKDTAAVMAIHALMGEGLSLNAQSIKTVRLLALRHAHPRRAAVLGARALAAGLHADEAGLETLVRLLSGPRTEEAGKEPERVFSRQPGRDTDKDTGGGSGGGSGTNSRGNTDGGQGNGPGKDPEKDTGRDSSRNPGSGASRKLQSLPSAQTWEAASIQAASGQVMAQVACQDETVLQKALESAFIDLSSKAAADPGFASLARRGPDGRGWLCVPFQFTIDGVAFSGYFRIIFNYASTKVERLVAEIDSSGLTRICDVSWAAPGKPVLRFMSESLAEGDQLSLWLGSAAQVALVQPGEVSGSVDALYREVDGHA